MSEIASLSPALTLQLGNIMMRTFALVCFIAIAPLPRLHAQLAFNAVVGRESLIDDTFTERWSLQPGEMLFEYVDLGTYESVDAITTGPEGYLYAAGNNLGAISIDRFDVHTGVRIDPPFESFATFLGGPVYDMKHGPDGNLYAAATDFNLSGPSGTSAILRRIDGGSGAVTGEINLGEIRFVQGIDFSHNGQFMHVLHGPISYLPGQGARRVSTYDLFVNFSLPPNASPIEASGFNVGDSANDLTLGPDGLFYITDSTADAVLRYSAAGQFIDEFVEEDVHDLHFIDGRLLALSRSNWPQSNRIVEIDPLSGDVTTLIDGADDPTPGPTIFLQIAPFIVPEPGVVAILATASLLVLLLRRRDHSGEPLA